MAVAALTGHALLAVFAHPDDESLSCGGLLACCAERGARVSILCLTRGERGQGGREDDGRLGDTRTRELEAAARTLGVSDVDVLDHPDGMLPWVEAGRLDEDIVAAIRRTDPNVVVTFGEDGLYWHPDHVTIHERTTSVVGSLGAAAPALYYVTMPPGSMQAVVETVAPLSPGRQTPLTILGIADAKAFGALAETPTLVVDAGALAPRKLAAIRCHRTQLADDALDLLSDDDAVRLLGAEHFRRATVGSTGEAFIEQLRHA